MKPRLLVVELHHLGDAVLSLPFVRAAAEKFEVHVLCRPASAEIYQLLVNAPKVHAWEPPWTGDVPAGALAVLDAVRTQGRVLGALQLDTAACVWADARAAILMAGTRAFRRIGFPMTRGNYYASAVPWRRRKLAMGRMIEAAWKVFHPLTPLLTNPLHRAAPDQPHLRCWEQIAEASGVACDYSVPWFQPPRPPDAVTVFRHEAAGCGRQVLAVHAQARLPGKQWPHERWKELLSLPEVSGRFAVVEILPHGEESPFGSAALSVKTPDVATLASVLSAADAVVCHDSLPAHLAAALGKPVVAIFGSGEPDWFAPWRNRQRVVQKRVCPLHPCIDHCGMDRFICLEQVQVTDVFEQLEKLPRMA